MERIAVLTSGGDCPGMNGGQIKVASLEYAWKKKKIDLGFCHLSRAMTSGSTRKLLVFRKFRRVSRDFPQRSLRSATLTSL